MCSFGDPMSKVFELRSHYQLINDYLTELKSVLREAEIKKCVFYQLPVPNKKDELLAPKFIPVEQHNDQQALNLAINCLDAFKKQPNESGKLAMRYPAVIVIAKAHQQQICSYIDKINTLKQEFKKLVLTYSNSNARFEAVHQAVPGLLTLAFYRQLHYETNDPYSVRFTWMHKHSTKTLSKKAALDLLEKSSGYTNPRMIDQTQWLKLIEQEKRRLGSLSNSTKLKIRRPTRVTPEVNVRFAREQRYHVSAAMPFFLFSDNESVKIGELKNYQAKNDTRKQQVDYLINRLYLTKSE